MTTQIETTKTFRRLAQLGGFYPPILKKSHRGLVARLSLPRIEKFELAEFEKDLKPLCTHAPVAYKENGRLVHYINL